MQYYGPQDPECDRIHAEKHRQPNETFREAMTRVSSRLMQTEENFRALRDITLQMRYLFGGRIQASIGSLKTTTAHNCYVSGTIEDSFIDGQGSIMERATQAATTMRMGGGIGYDFSTLRPKGALIKKLSSHSGGPLPFMEIFNAICHTVSSSGARRGAQMGILRVDHPDIEDFIRAKQNTHKLTGFNLSVAITDEFMSAVDKDQDFNLRFSGQVYRTVRARDLWDTLMRATYDYAEPGVIFIDRINEMNNLSYCEEIAATNPCGEQPLPPFGACTLGSLNLVRYLRRPSLDAPWSFDFEQLALDLPYIVRAMDRVIDIAKYPLYEQEKEAHAKRRIGIGVTSAANCIEAIGHPYGSKLFCSQLGAILRNVRDGAYEASAYLAKELGPFPLYNREKYLKSPFIHTLSSDVRDLIAEYGIRNSHLLSIAPTGTISFTADNVSSGIEPVFAYASKRTVVEAEGVREVSLQDYGVKYLGVHGKTAEHCSVEDHLNVLITASRYVDSAVSKTCNVPTDIDWEDFKNIYFNAWQNDCKGCTTYRVGGLREAVIQKTEEGTKELVCEIDPETGRRNCE